MAVNGFFVLSGLLIMKSLATRNNLKSYAVSRLLRIYPALIAIMIAFVFIFSTLFSKPGGLILYRSCKTPMDNSFNVSRRPNYIYLRPIDFRCFGATRLHMAIVQIIVLFPFRHGPMALARRPPTALVEYWHYRYFVRVFWSRLFRRTISYSFAHWTYAKARAVAQTN